MDFHLVQKYFLSSTVTFIIQEDVFLPTFFFNACVIVLMVLGEISLSLEQVLLSYRVSPGIEGEIVASNSSFPFWAPTKPLSEWRGGLGLRALPPLLQPLRAQDLFAHPI